MNDVWYTRKQHKKLNRVYFLEVNGPCTGTN